MTNYKEYFLSNHDYIYCEMCGRSDSYSYEVHHIVYRSEAPKHSNLNNNKNLILLCSKCHKLIHSNKSIRNNLIDKRGLQELFEWKLKR